MWIIDRSKQAAERGEVWRMEDHQALVDHLRKIDETAIGLARLAETMGLELSSITKALEGTVSRG